LRDASRPPRGYMTGQRITGRMTARPAVAVDAHWVVTGVTAVA
jgi:hypothetical protein